MTIVFAGSTIAVSPTVPESQAPTHIELSVPVETVSQTQLEEETDLSPEPAEEKPEPTKDSLLCNCYRYVDSVVDLPHSSVVKNNLGDSGNVAVFYYPESGLYHYALVLDKDESSVTISETNFRRCQYTQRVIGTEYPYLLGFYNA